MWMNSSEASLLLAGNALLSGLDHDDLRLLVPHLSRAAVKHGDTLFSAGDTIEWVFFPETAVIALLDYDKGDHAIEIGLVGREGFVGWPSILGCTVATCRADVQLDGGTLLTIRASHLSAACQDSPTLLRSLLRFVEAATVQMSCTMLSNSSYPLASRLARWLLMRHDRMSHDTLSVQHDEISVCLGVRRASVTDCLHLLEGEGLIRSRRGKITIRDRERLRERAGQCYGAAEAHHESVLEARRGKSGTADARLGFAGKEDAAAPTLTIGIDTRSIART